MKTISDIILAIAVGITAVALVVGLSLVGEAADCTNCYAGLVGPGPVKYVCPLCEGVGEFPDKLQAVDQTIHQACDGSVEMETKPIQFQQPAKVKAGSPRQALVRIVSKGRTINKFSGVLIDPTTVLTAWHCIAGQPTAVEVHCQNGKVLRGSVVSSSEPWDIAVIEVPESDAAFTPLAADGPEIGDELEVAGYGPGIRRGIFRAFKGRVARHAFPMDGLPEEMFEVTGSARKGDSGGPIFNSAGEVIGIISGVSDGVTIGSNAVAIRGVLEMPRAAAVSNCPNGKCQKR